MQVVERFRRTALRAVASVAVAAGVLSAAVGAGGAPRVAAAQSNASGQPARPSGQPVEAGTITNSPPMVAYAADGTTLQGVIPDLAAAMSKPLGRSIRFAAIPFDGLFPAMQAHRIDIAFTLMNDTPEREKLVDFVDFFRLSTTILVKKGNPFHVASLESLCGLGVATVRGSTQIQLVDEQNAHCKSAGKPAINNLEYTQPAEARLQVQTGHLAAFLGNSPVLSYLARTAGNGAVFEVIPGHSYQPVPLGIAVPKRETALRDSLKNALEATISDGSYRKVLEKYGVESGAIDHATINAGASLKM